MDAIGLLTEEHRDAEDLFERLELTDQEDVRAELLTQLARSLALHALIEEQHFYPAARGLGSRATVDQALEHHLGVKELLTQLLELDPGDESFLDKLEELREAVEQHVAEEELEVFPRVRRALDPETLRELGEQMSASREAASEIDPTEVVAPDVR
jgi:hemerythrin superfamily protein